MQVCVEEHYHEEKRFQVFDQKGICKYYAVQKPVYIRRKTYLYEFDGDKHLYCISKSLIGHYGRFKIFGQDGNIVGRVKTRKTLRGYQEIIFKSIYGRIVIKRRRYSDRFKIYFNKELIGAIVRKEHGLRYLLDVKDDKYLSICISLIMILRLYRDNITYKRVFG